MKGVRNMAVRFSDSCNCYSPIVREEEEWVLVRRATERDLWNPSVGDRGETSKPLMVTFSGPAKHWTDAIPIGNGGLGTMMWDGVTLETLQLNVDQSCRNFW